MSGRLVRKLTGFRVGEIVLLRNGTEGHPPGALVRVERIISTDAGGAYIVQPMGEQRAAHGSPQLVPDGPRLTLEAHELARSLPGYRTGPTTLAGVVAQAAHDLAERRRSNLRLGD